MNQFALAVLTLDNAIYVIVSVMANSNMDVQTLHKRDLGVYQLWDIINDIGWSVSQDVSWNESKNVSSAMIWNVTKKESEIAKQNGKTDEEIIEAICFSVMKNYNKISSAIIQLGKNIKIREKINPSKIIRQLITFNKDQLKKLSTMSKRFRLFIFFQIQQIISLVDKIDNSQNKDDLIEFYDMLKRIGDFRVYSELFESDITLDMLTFIIDIPRELIKLIISYIHLSIYDGDDLNFILNKIFHVQGKHVKLS